MSRLSRLALLALTVVVSAVGLFSYLASPLTPNSTQKIEFVTLKGQSLDQITSNLKRQKLVRSSSVAKLSILIQGISKDIQAGYFYLSPSKNTGQIVSSLTEASNRQVWVTIPEGLRRQEIALTIEDYFNKSDPNPNFSALDFVSQTSSLEGHLFPETYAFSPNSSTETIVKKLTNQFDKIIQDLGIPAIDLNQTLILASLIEREAGGPGEMLEIAGILKKRLQADWPLQIDATVQFAVATQRCSNLDCDYWTNDLSRNDIDTPSAYNTYKNTGLPAGPISSPGKQALKAAFEATTSPYWFYLHDLSGQIHYSKTIEEHNQNVCSYLKKDC
jgi:UPF0755 protein